MKTKSSSVDCFNHCRIKITDDGHYVDVSIGKNVVYFSMTRLGVALTVHRAELLGKALLEAATRLNNAKYKKSSQLTDSKNS